MTRAADTLPADRAAKLLRAVVIATTLGVALAGLAVAASLAVPVPRGWGESRLPILVVVACNLGPLLLWSRRRGADAGWAVDAVAMALGVASAALGIGAVLLVTYGIGLQISEARETPRVLAYRMTHPAALAYLSMFALVPALPGVPGLWLARRRERATGRVSLAGAAARYSAMGLGLATLIAGAIAAAAAYRWLIWG